MIRRPVTAAAAAALSVVVLTGCGVALENQTYQPRQPYEATNASVADTVVVRGLHVEAPDDELLPAGGSAKIRGIFVNKGQEPDALVGVTTDAASAATLEVEGKSALELEIPGQGRTPNDVAIVLQGLTEELRPGQFITVTLTFKRAGRTEVSIPIRAGDLGLAERERQHVEH